MPKFFPPGRKRLLLALAVLVALWTCAVEILAAWGPVDLVLPDPFCLAATARGTPVGFQRPEDLPHDLFDSGTPALGDLAPDFTLRDVEGKPFRLSERDGETPVVIEFGSFT